MQLFAMDRGDTDAMKALKADKAVGGEGGDIGIGMDEAAWEVEVEVGDECS